MITKSGKINGGKRPGAGRPKGVGEPRSRRTGANRSGVARNRCDTSGHYEDQDASSALSNGTLVTDDQFAAACALAPYLHPKLTAVAVRDIRPDTSAQIEDNTPSIRLLLQQALGGEPKVIDANRVTDEFPKDRDGRPRLE